MCLCTSCLRCEFGPGICQEARCAGLDIGKADLKECVRTPGGRAGSHRHEVRTFRTTTAGLLELRDSWQALFTVATGPPLPA